MKKLMSLPVILIGVVIVLGLWVMGIYNSLVSLDENVNNAWAKIETQYQRRFDLIPNIIETVKGSSEFEKSTFTAITEARSAWMGANTQGGKIAAAKNLEVGLGRLMATFEAYPNLKSTTAYRDLITELEGTENRISFARDTYNDAATAYNKSTRTFPKNMLVNIFGFDQKKELFEAEENADKAVKVNFN